MEETPSDLRKKIARYRRSLAVMNDPETIKMIERMIKETEQRFSTSSDAETDVAAGRK